MSKHTEIVEVHRKDCWRVTLFADGGMVIASMYLNGKRNRLYVVAKDSELDFEKIEAEVPAYVFYMYLEMVIAHPEIFPVMTKEEELAW